MIPIKQVLGTWPLRRNGEPIFRTTNDAILYAQLVSHRTTAVDEMIAWREKAHRDLQRSRKRKYPSLDRLMVYATKAQFFRECAIEILRIQDEEAK